MTPFFMHDQDLPKEKPYVERISIPLVHGFIIKPKPTQRGSYDKLECTQNNKETIEFIIQTMAQNNVFSLGTRRNELNRMGDTLSGVHPLKFLETLFATEEMKEHVVEIFKSSFKRESLMAGLSGNLTVKSKMNDLDIYIDDFAKAVHVPKEEINPFFTSKDWDGLVRHLMNR